MLERDGRLAVDWPGETIYDLAPPDEEGVWKFLSCASWAVSFQEDGAGRVQSMTYHGGGKSYVMGRLEDSLPSPRSVRLDGARGVDQEDRRGGVRWLRDVAAQRLPCDTWVALPDATASGRTYSSSKAR